MRLMFCFDPRDANGYVVRLPEFLAKRFCRLASRHGASLDYAPNEGGF